MDLKVTLNYAGYWLKAEVMRSNLIGMVFVPLNVTVGGPDTFGPYYGLDLVVSVGIFDPTKVGVTLQYWFNGRRKGMTWQGHVRRTI